MNDDVKLVLTKEELKNINYRWVWGSQLGWNYERMQGLGYTYAVAPMLKKLYTNDDEMREALRMHLQFFNTQPDCGNIVLGAAVAMESSKGLAAKDTIAGLKTGLMGPFAAIGDTVYGVIFGTIFGAIAATMAVDGSPVGAIIWVLASVGLMFFRETLFNLGYSQGSKLITTMSHKLTALTDSASVLGLMVIGALVATMVRATTPLTFTFGDFNMVVQYAIIDKIMPKFLPVCVVVFVYWLLGLKKMTSSKVIFIILILGILLSVLGILGPAPVIS